VNSPDSPWLKRGLRNVHERPLRGLPAVMVPLTMTTVVDLFDEANWDAGKEDGLSIGVKNEGSGKLST
jgi:hypothetical protein